MSNWRPDRRAACAGYRDGLSDPSRALLGAHGRAAIADREVPTWFATLCHAGMPHHLALLPGHQSHLLRRFARQMGVRWGEGC